MVLVEEKGKIVAYPQGETFTQETIRKIKPGLKTYLFTAMLCDEKENNCEEQELTVHANNFKNAKKAIGYGSKYEEEWGDFASIIEMLHKKDDRLTVHLKECNYTDIDQKEW